MYIYTMKKGYVYILANKYRTVLYIGVTSNLERRLQEHKLGDAESFTSKYNCNILVHYEEYSDISNAIAREKQLKNWKREWKEALIKELNPHMEDLSKDW